MTQGPETAMPDILIEPKDCTLVLVDQQAGLAFGVGSIDRQTLLNNVIALARTATVFGMPIVASTSATKVYSGPLMPAIHTAIPEVVAIERRNMNMWEDHAARAAIVATGRRKLIFSGLLTEACVTFPVLSARAEGYEVHVVGDACGGLPPVSHDLSMRRMEAAGAKPTSWIQVLLELQRDWTRHETYDGARAIVEASRRRIRYRFGLCTGYDQAYVRNAPIIHRPAPRAWAAAHAPRESARELILISEAANQRNQQASLSGEINRLAASIFKSERSFL